jgi:hypothetical protein
MTGVLVEMPTLLCSDRQHKVRWSFGHPLVPGNESCFAAVPVTPRQVARVIEKILDRLQKK